MSLENLSDEELNAIANAPEEAPISTPEESTGVVESFARGAAEAIPGASQVAGVVGSLYGEGYEKSQSDWKRAQEQARIDNPVAFGTGEVTTDVAAFTALNTVVPGAGLLKNAVTLGGWTFSKEATDHPEQSLGSSLHKSAVNTMVGLSAGKAVEVAGNIAIPYAKKVADTTAAHWLTDNVSKAWGIFDSHVAKNYNTNAKLPKEVATSKYIDSLRNYVYEGNSLLDSKSTVHSVGQGAEALQEKYGNRIGNYISKNNSSVDVELVQTKLINGRKVISGLDQNTVAVNEAANAELQKTFFNKKVISAATKDSEEVVEWMPKKLNLSDVHDLKRSWAKQSSLLQKEAAGVSTTANASLKAEELKNRVGALSEFIKDSLPDSPEWSTMNKKWMDMNVLSDITSIKGDKMHGSSAFNKIREVASYAGGVGLGFAAQQAGVPLMGAMAIGAATKKVLASGETLAPKLSASLFNLANYMEKVPGSAIAMRATAALNGNVEGFHTVMMASASELNLKQAPLSRDNIDLKNRSDDVLQTMQSNAPELTDALRKAIEADDEEAMASTMEQLSKHPAAKGLIKDGQGWNGKVRDPADKAGMIKQINGMNVSLKQKLELKKNLNLQGTIPVLKQEEPYYINYKARDKGAPAY